MASPGRFLGRTLDDGVFQRLRSALATGAGGGDVAVPAGVGAEVAFPRSHLMEASRGELVPAHKRVGLDRPSVRVSGRIWRGLVPFCYEEVLAFELSRG